MSMDFRLFLPQMRLPLPDMVERARVAEAAGFGGIALMDHLAPPLAEQHDMWDAMLTAGWIAAHTDRLGVGHLVLCDAFRHPSMLAKQAVTLDHASGGRFELGIGWGSVPDEMTTFGVGDTSGAHRIGRLTETLEVCQALWTGEAIDYAGAHHHVTGGQQNPPPLGKIPILIGGAGPKTMALVARFADWWNCPIHRLDRYDELRDSAGTARVSLQYMVAFVPDEASRAEVTETAQRRFGYHGDGLIIGSGPELIDRFGALGDRGVERIYAWMADFGRPETLAAFGEQVIDEMPD